MVHRSNGAVAKAGLWALVCCTLMPFSTFALPNGVTSSQLSLERKAVFIRMIFLPDGRSLGIERSGNVFLCDVGQAPMPVVE